jgi:hypothetical protein
MAVGGGICDTAFMGSRVLDRRDEGTDWKAPTSLHMSTEAMEARTRAPRRPDVLAILGTACRPQTPTQYC